MIDLKKKSVKPLLDTEVPLPQKQRQAQVLYSW